MKPITEKDKATIREALLPAWVTDAEFDLFIATAETAGLNPIAKEIQGTPGRNKVDGQWVNSLTIVTTIGGLRSIAARTGAYTHQGYQEWCGNDGQWVDVWLNDGPPAAARCTVFKNGSPFPAVVTWSEFGSDNMTWRSMPSHMLSKCAEAHALRKAFPDVTAGLYTDDEMSSGVEVESRQDFLPDPVLSRSELSERLRSTASTNPDLYASVRDVFATMKAGKHKLMFEVDGRWALASNIPPNDLKRAFVALDRMTETAETEPFALTEPAPEPDAGPAAAEGFPENLPSQVIAAITERAEPLTASKLLAALDPSPEVDISAVKRACEFLTGEQMLVKKGQKWGLV